MSNSIQQLNSILILDDDVLQAKALSKKIQKEGYKVTGVTHTGVQAIESVKQQAPDIALLDINLNGQAIDGVEVGTAIQHLHQNIIIIYLTAYANDENFKKALQSKPYAFIEKPYQMKTLNREIEMAIEKVLQLKDTIPRDEPATNLTLPTNNTRLISLPNCLLLKEGVGAGHQKIILAAILYLKADGNFTYIFTKNKKIYATILLRVFEEHFLSSSLQRVHNSYIVNLSRIKEIQVKNNGGSLLLDNGSSVPVSKGYVQKFWKDLHTFEQRK